MFRYLMIASIALSAWACAPLPKELDMIYTPHDMWIYPPTRTRVVEKFLPKAELFKKCENVENKGGLEGCSSFYFNKTWCGIYILDDPTYTPHQIQQIRDHEIAHCNGWSHP